MTSNQLQEPSLFWVRVFLLRFSPRIIERCDSLFYKLSRSYRRTLALKRLRSFS